MCPEDCNVQRGATDGSVKENWHFSFSRCEAVEGAVSLLGGKLEDINRYCVEVNSLENRGGPGLPRSHQPAFRRRKDPIQLIKWKEIYETLEHTATSARMPQYPGKRGTEKCLIALSAAVWLSLQRSSSISSTIPRHGNAAATCISTRALSIRSAILAAAVLNFCRAMISTKVATTIGKGIVDR
jgi:hypothetical protein